MKQILVTALMLLMFWNCNHIADNSVKSKSDKIRQSLSKKGINSYFRNDTLYVVNDKGIEINKIYINLKKLEKEWKIDFDTSYYIEQQQDARHIFVVLGDNSDVGNLFFGLIDQETKKWLVKQNFDGDNLPNIIYCGSSDNNTFHLFEGGTSGDEGDFLVFNSQNQVVKHGGYYPTDDHNQLKWMKENKFYYYHDRDKNDTLLKDLPKLEKGFYAQKHFFVNGKDSASKEYKEIYSE